jgi:tetratricopeptide (TPR) repeat protein
MSLFERKVLLDKDAWGGVQVVAHVAENVALDAAKQKAAQEQYAANRKAAHAELCEWLAHPNAGRDGDRVWALMNEGGFADIGQAQTLHQAGDLDGAIRMYQKLLASEADASCPVGGLGIFSGARLHFELAELYREKRDFVRAIPEYRTAVQLDPNDQRYGIGLVNALEDSGDLDTALSEVKEAMRMCPYNNVYFHYLLGWLLVKKNDPDGAIVELQWVLKQEKNHDWKASCALGRAYELKGDLKAALGQYRTAYRVQMDDKECRAAYERLHSQLKK